MSLHVCFESDHLLFSEKPELARQILAAAAKLDSINVRTTMDVLAASENKLALKQPIESKQKIDCRKQMACAHSSEMRQAKTRKIQTHGSVFA